MPCTAFYGHSTCQCVGENGQNSQNERRIDRAMCHALHSTAIPHVNALAKTAKIAKMNDALTGQCALHCTLRPSHMSMRWQKSGGMAFVRKRQRCDAADGRVVPEVFSDRRNYPPGKTNGSALVPRIDSPICPASHSMAIPHVNALAKTAKTAQMNDALTVQYALHRILRPFHMSMRWRKRRKQPKWATH